MGSRLGWAGWRWAAVAPIVFGLALCSDAALAQSMTKSQVPTCKSRDLGAKIELGAVAASAGRQAMTLAVQNRSSAACKVEGVPEIAFADSVKRPMPVHVCSNCPAYLFPVLPVETIVLQPRQSAYLVVQYKAMAGDEGCKEAATFSMRLGKEDKPLWIHLAGVRTCGVVDVTPFLARLPAGGLFPDSEAAEDAGK
jgi:hypothetical protein